MVKFSYIVKTMFFAILLVILFYTPPLYTQSVRVIDNKGTIKKIGNNRVFLTNNATSPVTSPDKPVEGDIWYDLDNTGSKGPIKIYRITNSTTGAGAWIKVAYKGTEGSVFFAGTDGYPTEDNSQFFWNNTLKRLHIGNPLTGNNKLTVNGQARAWNFNAGNGTNGNPAFRFANDLDTGMLRAAANQLAFSTNATEALRINASQNVGIGTTTPTKKLEVNGEVKINTLTAGNINDSRVVVDATGVLKKLSSGAVFEPVASTIDFEAIRTGTSCVYTVLSTDYTLVATNASSWCYERIVFPDASTANTGRVIIVYNTTGQIVYLRLSDGTLIDSLVAGQRRKYQSNGSDWVRVF